MYVEEWYDVTIANVPFYAKTAMEPRTKKKTSTQVMLVNNKKPPNSECHLLRR